MKIAVLCVINCIITGMQAAEKQKKPTPLQISVIGPNGQLVKYTPGNVPNMGFSPQQDRKNYTPRREVLVTRHGNSEKLS